MDTEFGQFIETLRRLGIPYMIHWQPPKEEWQQAILDAGYYITSFACNSVTVSDTDYLFSTGPVCWTNDDQGIGPVGLLLFSRKKSGEIIMRTLYDRQGQPTSIQNLDAIKRQYAGYPWDLAVTAATVRSAQ